MRPEKELLLLSTVSWDAATVVRRSRTNSTTTTRRRDDDDDDTFYRGDADYQDLESYLVLQAELDEAARDSAKRLAVEHSYSRSEASSSRGESARRRRRPGTFEYHFLYAVCLSGEDKRIFNNLPKAVAVLSNSKRLFLGHLSSMMRCLDPCLAELAYVDTDSCIWSLTRERLEDCLLPSRAAEWRRLDLIADEAGSASCHGKMKLEGTFVAGRFRTMKIYRLYKIDEEKESEEKEGGSRQRLFTAYTRCKGVNRYIATRLPDFGFDSSSSNRLIVHRNTLRPTRKGEILLAHESRSVSVPFNLKRKVCEDGYHTLPFSGAPGPKLGRKS